MRDFEDKMVLMPVPPTNGDTTVVMEPSDDDEYYMERMAQILDSYKTDRPPKHPVRLSDHLYIGNQDNADDLDLLPALGITHVLNMAGTRNFDLTRSPYKPKVGVKAFLMIPAEDYDEYDIKQYFVDTNAFLDKAKSTGGQALVHCNYGVNRSGAVAAAYLMVSERKPLLRVIEELKAKRSLILGNVGFRRQLIKFARSRGLLDCVEQRRPSLRPSASSSRLDATAADDRCVRSVTPSKSNGTETVDGDSTSLHDADVDDDIYSKYGMKAVMQNAKTMMETRNGYHNADAETDRKASDYPSSCIRTTNNGYSNNHRDRLNRDIDEIIGTMSRKAEVTTPISNGISSSNGCCREDSTKYSKVVQSNGYHEGDAVHLTLESSTKFDKSPERDYDLVSSVSKYYPPTEKHGVTDPTVTSTPYVPPTITMLPPAEADTDGEMTQSTDKAYIAAAVALPSFVDVDSSVYLPKSSSVSATLGRSSALEEYYEYKDSISSNYVNGGLSMPRPMSAGCVTKEFTSSVKPKSYYYRRPPAAVVSDFDEAEIDSFMAKSSSRNSTRWRSTAATSALLGRRNTSVPQFVDDDTLSHSFARRYSTPTALTTLPMNTNHQQQPRAFAQSSAVGTPVSSYWPVPSAHTNRSSTIAATTSRRIVEPLTDISRPPHVPQTTATESRSTRMSTRYYQPSSKYTSTTYQHGGDLRNRGYDLDGDAAISFSAHLPPLGQTVRTRVTPAPGLHGLRVSNYSSAVSDFARITY